MLRYFLLLLALPILLMSEGCASQTGGSARPGQEFNLEAGQSASIVGENLKIRFIEVTNDSRCPQGATCIWAGEAGCLVEITDSESSLSRTLVQPGFSRPAKTDFKEYEITFDLQPYPEVGKERQIKDYRLHLAISKKTALTGDILMTQNDNDKYRR